MIFYNLLYIYYICLILYLHNIFIKDLNGKLGIDGEYVRFAVRDTEDDDIFIKALLKYFTV